MDALIIVDLQNDFMPGGAMAVPEGHRVVPVVNAILQRGAFDLVVATQDWHPANHGSFAASHADRRQGEMIELAGLRQILLPVHCVQGTPGADFVAEFDRSRVNHVVHKGTDPMIDSYSGFFDNARRRATGLEEYLRSRGVRGVAICGLATDYAVKYTALDARDLGFETCLIDDACRGMELHPGDVAAAIDQMKRAGVEVVTSEQVIRR